MDVHLPTPLLGGLSPRQFMKRHWQRKPLLVRGAVPGMRPVADRGELFELASRDEVESRLVEQRDDGRWSMRRGPFTRRSLPPLARPRWTLLVRAWTCTSTPRMNCCSASASCPRRGWTT